MTGWLNSWRAAVRIARRDAWRAKGRSALVLSMIALPILGVSAADITIRSSELSTEQQLERDLGAADARFFSADTGGVPIMQTPEADGSYATDEKYDDDPRLFESKPVDVRPRLPEGAKWITDREGPAVVRTRHGLLDARVREIRAEHPLAAGLMTVRKGQLPTRSDEIAATTTFLEQSGLHIGSHTTMRGLDTRFRIVGAVELPNSLGDATLIARPGAALDRLAKAGEAHAGRSAAQSSYLVSVSGKVTWAMVKQANREGVIAKSKDVVLNPPPREQVPYYAKNPGADSGGGDDAELITVAATVVSMAVLEICLLAGPAFAVGARRSRRQLGLVGANGGDRRHIRAIVVSGGIVIGATAAAVGVALGLALTLALRPVLEGVVGQRFGGIELRPAELLAIALVGLITGLLAAIVPAFVASRQSVLEALTGRRGVRRSSRVLPVVGLGAVLLGVGIAVFGAVASSSALSIGIGSGIAELGLVALTPALVGLFGRTGRWLPLSPRLALRDAVRNRGRTAPAVAAVLAAVAGTVAVATYMASDERQSRDRYVASLPAGGVAVTVPPEELPELARIREALRQSLPVMHRADVSRIVVGRKDCGTSGEVGNGCGSAELVTPKANECGLYADGNDTLTAAQRRAMRTDWRCEDDSANGGFPDHTNDSLQVGGPAVLRALHIRDDGAERALARGEAVVFNRHFVDRGTVKVEAVTEYQPGEEEPRGREYPFPAHLSKGESYGIDVLLPPAAARAAHLKTVPSGSYYDTPRTPSGSEEQRLKGALSKLGVQESPYVERGFRGESSIIMLALAIFAGVVTIGAAGIATGLAQADAEADLATLAAVGAAPRVRRTLSGMQCGVVAAMGVVLGTAAGVVPAIGLLKAEERSALRAFTEAQREGWPSSPVHVPIVVPWGTVLEILVVVPLGAALLAAVFTRSRTALARRAG